jgi:hypothetical protein
VNIMINKRSDRLRTQTALALGLAVSLCCALALCVLSSPAQAAFGIAPGGYTFKSLNADGTFATQAGAHPARVTTDFHINMTGGLVDGNFRSLHFELPPGLVGDPLTTATCTHGALALLGVTGGPHQFCPPDSQVGVVYVRYATSPSAPEVVPLFALDPSPGKTAQLGFPVATVSAVVDAGVDTAGDFSVQADVRKAPETQSVEGVTVELWGVPNDPLHDDERTCGTSSKVQYPAPCPVSAPRKPFLTNPSVCSVPLLSSLTTDSWENPGVFRSASHESPAPTGCDRLRFSPSIEVTAGVDRADAPTSLGVDLTLPQADDLETGLAAPPMRDVTVTLPEGMTINPASAGGLQACTDAQLGLKSDAPVQCPDGAKIGTVRADTPVLKEPLTGSVYLRTQNSDDPASGEMFRLAIVLENQERGLLVKLPGQVRVDPATGRVTSSFRDNPQLPVGKISLQLKSGPRAPLATPVACGEKTVQTSLTSWAGHAVERASSLPIACRSGLGGFSPSLVAGVTSPAAGAFSPFSLSLSKPDGDAAIDGLSMVLPTGLLARLKGNLGTQVGTVKAYAGPGSNPYMLPGQVYLEGQYGDAPFSLRVVVPAKAGPFDLGEVVVRQKIYVDPITAQVTVVSDPVPTIVKGVPVRLQRLDVDVDKAEFIINPTSCAAKSVGGVLHGVSGATADLSVRFQVSDCSSLALKPSLALSLSGKGQTVDGKHPAITASLTQPAGQANLKKVRVALPLSLALDTDNANGLCEFVDGSKVTPTCPKASIVGSVTATTPILDEPLTGPVYFVKNVRKDPKSGRDIRTLPKLVIPLVGQNGVKLTLTGTSEVEDDQLVTTFDSIPDAPVSTFKLDINGGKGGILAVSGTDICKSTQIAEQQVDGQNGKAADADVFIQTPSCPLKVLSKKVGAKSVTLKVGGLGAGKLTVTGKGINKTTKTIGKSTVVTIVVKRTGHAKPGKVKVSFLAAGAKKAETAGAMLR